jgi:O-antigen/teichoic acid export membrane protein
MIGRSEAISQRPARKIRIGLLGRNISWSVLGNAGYLATQWGILMLMARSGGPELVGQYTLALALTAPVMMLAGMQLRLLQGTDAENRFALSDYLGFRAITVGAALAIVGGITQVAPLSETTRDLVLIVGIIKALDLVADTFFGQWQQQERLQLICIARVGNGLVSLAGFWAISVISGDMVLGLGFSAFVSLLALIVIAAVWVMGARERSVGQGRTQSKGDDLASIRPIWVSAKQLEILKLGFPLAIVAAVISVEANLPRMVINWQLGTDALGIYSAMAYGLLVGSTLMDAVGNAVSPRLAKLVQADRKREFLGTMLTLIAASSALSVVVVIVAAVMGKPLLTWIYSEQFASESSLLVLLAIAVGIQFLGTILGFGMVVVRRLKTQALIYCAGLLVSIGLLIPLTARFGLLGIGLTAIAVAVLKTVSAAVVVKRHLDRWDAPA